MIMIVRRPLVGTTAESAHGPNLWGFKSQGYKPLSSHLPRLQMPTPLSLVLKPREGWGIIFGEYSGGQMFPNFGAPTGEGSKMHTVGANYLKYCILLQLYVCF